MKVSAIICAAGSGSRAKLGKNKVLAPLRGAPVIYHTLKAFAGADEIIIAAARRDFEEIESIAAPFGAKICEGGQTRTESIYNALKMVTGEIVLIHDAARPFVSKAQIARCIEDVKKFGSSVSIVPSSDSLAHTTGAIIDYYPDRAAISRVQTPQGFKSDEIKSLYERAHSEGLEYTDDGSLFLDLSGETPHATEGERGNIKLTFPEDFAPTMPIASLAEGMGKGLKIGCGEDVHAFCEGSFVTLCGESIPCDRALKAHSDGDVAVHAVMDAILSAAGLRDIGFYFPDTDEKFRGANSLELLKRVRENAFNAGYVPTNISISIQAEKPKLKDYIEKMRANLAAAVSLPPQAVGITAGTSEGLGFVGEGLGIYCCAVALLKSID